MSNLNEQLELELRKRYTKAFIKHQEALEKTERAKKLMLIHKALIEGLRGYKAKGGMYSDAKGIHVMERIVEVQGELERLSNEIAKINEETAPVIENVIRYLKSKENKDFRRIE